MDANSHEGNYDYCIIIFLFLEAVSKKFDSLLPRNGSSPLQVVNKL